MHDYALYKHLIAEAVTIMAIISALIVITSKVVPKKIKDLTIGFWVLTFWAILISRVVSRYDWKAVFISV
jgi:hypothetical protein